MKKIISLLALMVIMMCGVVYAEEIDSDKTIKLNRYITDSLDDYNEVDYFNFDLSRQGSVQIEFEFEVEGKYTVKLYDVDNNKEIQSTSFYTNYNTTSGSETLYANKLRLPAGDYRIKVSTSSSSFTDENYRIRVNYEQESKGNYEVESNNDAKSAMEIIVLWNKPDIPFSLSISLSGLTKYWTAERIILNNIKTPSIP